MINVENLKSQKTETSINIVIGNVVIASVEKEKFLITYNTEFEKSLDISCINFIKNVALNFNEIYNQLLFQEKTLKPINLTDADLQWLNDYMYLPATIKDNEILKSPFFEGRGNHSVNQLENICEQFKDFIFQQSIIKQNCMQYIIELRKQLNK